MLQIRTGAVDRGALIRDFSQYQSEVMGPAGEEDVVLVALDPVGNRPMQESVQGIVKKISVDGRVECLGQSRAAPWHGPVTESPGKARAL